MGPDWGEKDPAWAGIVSEHREVAGHRVHLLRADGPTDGPVQLLIHGLGGAAINWLEVMRPLAERGPVLAPDLPGFGSTPPPRPGASRIEHNLAFLTALLTEEGIGAAEVHGNSMGGMLATLLAGEEPQRVTRLVLVDPALPGTERAPHRLDAGTIRLFAPFVVPSLGARLVGRMYATRTAEELVADFQDLVHADATRLRPALRDALIVNAVHGQQMPWRAEGLAVASGSLLRLLASRRRLHRALDAIVAPTLLIRGEDDRLIGRSVVDATMARRPDLDLRVLPGLGHAPMMEAPARYLEAVSDWLETPTLSAA
ncbi:MAG: alpha/beta fold hydrolase [Nitriliruptoraceae bacterium]